MNHPFDLTGKTALVTGAGEGIGAACAGLFAQMGASVMATDINEEAVHQLAHGFQEQGYSMCSHFHDVSRVDDWAEVVDATLDHFPGWDILINNAGIYIGGTVEQNSSDDVRRINVVNIESVFLGTQQAINAMKPGGRAGVGGSIINMSSVASLLGLPGHSAYGATKGAVEAYTRHTAVEAGRLGYGIRVNSIHPGLIKTRMGAMVFDDFVKIGLAADHDQAEQIALGLTPLGRFGEVQDVAHAAAFLASDAASYITGAALTVDGGASAA